MLRPGDGGSNLSVGLTLSVLISSFDSPLNVNVNINIERQITGKLRPT